MIHFLAELAQMWSFSWRSRFFNLFISRSCLCRLSELSDSFLCMHSHISFYYQSINQKSNNIDEEDLLKNLLLKGIEYVGFQEIQFRKGSGIVSTWLRCQSVWFGHPQVQDMSTQILAEVCFLSTLLCKSHILKHHSTKEVDIYCRLRPDKTSSLRRNFSVSLQTQ